MRAVRKDGIEPTTEMVAEWETSMLEQDKVHRERLFILSIAAEKGWRIASEVAFIKKGKRMELTQGVKFQDCSVMLFLQAIGPTRP